jgi:hypothetical protein
MNVPSQENPKRTKEAMFHYAQSHQRLGRNRPYMHVMGTGDLYGLVLFGYSRMYLNRGLR